MPRLFIALLALAACNEVNSQFCDNPANKTDPHCMHGGSCTSRDMCMDPNFPACDTVNGVCVPCLASTDCPMANPVCDTMQHTCGLCTKHSDCTSSACLPTGECGVGTGGGANVAYVDPMGTDNASCTVDAKCKSTAAALATTRPYIKYTGATHEAAAVSIMDRNVTLLAEPGASITAMAQGKILSISGTSSVGIYDLEITGAAGATGIGIAMEVGSTGVLTLRRATVSMCNAQGVYAGGGSRIDIQQSSIVSNDKGGILIVGAPYTLINNVIVKNGGASSLFGGVSMMGAGTDNSFQFNTVADNGAMGANPDGVLCPTAADLGNGIVFHDFVSATCNVTFTLSDMTISGAANRMGDPKFVQTNDPKMPGFYRIKSDSDAKDQADLNATLPIDIDGDSRLIDRKDMGADEFHQ